MGFDETRVQIWRAGAIAPAGTSVRIDHRSYRRVQLDVARPSLRPLMANARSTGQPRYGRGRRPGGAAPGRASSETREHPAGAARTALPPVRTEPSVEWLGHHTQRWMISETHAIPGREDAGAVASEVVERTCLRSAVLSGYPGSE